MKNSPDSPLMPSKNKHNEGLGNVSGYAITNPICPVFWVIIIFAAFSGLLSGCHPCALPGVCDELSKNVTAYVGYKGDIYFDIPVRKNYKRAELLSIYINGVKDGEATGVVWSIEEKPFKYQRQQDGIVPDMPLPLRYGQIVPEAETYVEPQAIKNGLYAIWGFVNLYDKQGKQYFEVSGRFSYKNGAVQNLTNWEAWLLY